MKATLVDLNWQSDWNGYEVGYGNSEVVGLYTCNKLYCDFYVDVETNKVLEIMPHDEHFEDSHL